MCTLIHDSQADKKAFVHGLRDTYERWLAADDDLDVLTARRAALVARVDRLLTTVATTNEPYDWPPTRRESNRCHPR